MSSEMDEKLIELVRKCDELYDISHKKYSDSVVIIIIGIQPLGRSGQRPEFSQATGMSLVRCILGKFLGVACHCFPPLFLDIPTFHHQVPPRPPRRERSQRRKWELWARMLSGNFVEMTSYYIWNTNKFGGLAQR